jgi:hypothetical protein
VVLSRCFNAEGCESDEDCGGSGPCGNSRSNHGTSPGPGGQAGGTYDPGPYDGACSGSGT